MTPRMHLIAVGVILLVTLLLLLVTGQISVGEKPDNAVEAEVDTDSVLLILSATWGDNCNDYIQSQNANPPRDEDGRVSGEILPLVKRDNVLREVSSLCNARVTCAFPVGEQILGTDPAPGCTKALVVDYRCGELGVTDRITAYSGSEFRLDCAAGAPAAN